MERYLFKKKGMLFSLKVQSFGHNFQPCRHDPSEKSDEFHKRVKGLKSYADIPQVKKNNFSSLLFHGFHHEKVNFLNTICCASQQEELKVKVSPNFVANALGFLVDGIVTDWNKNDRKVIFFIPSPANSPAFPLTEKKMQSFLLPHTTLFIPAVIIQ